MNETVIVAAIVALATLQVARRYFPRSWLRKLWPGTASALVSRPPNQAACGTGCSSCKGCGTGGFGPARR